MQFASALKPAVFRKRYKRFFADVELSDGSIVVAHVPNTGSLDGCLHPGAECLISESNDPKRKLKATLHFLKTPSGWAGADTSLPNKLVYEAWQRQEVPAWRHFGHGQLEVKISAESRIDLVLATDSVAFANKQTLHYVEVKNVTLAEGSRAQFPDAKTERGQKHLRELTQLAQIGHSAEMVFVVQRQRCDRFAPADHIDSQYGQLLRQAARAGVTLTAYNCYYDLPHGIQLKIEPLPIEL